MGAAGLEFEPMIGLGVGSKGFATDGFAVLHAFPWFGVGLGTHFPSGEQRAGAQ
jgi:hypothetical protein